MFLATSLKNKLKQTYLENNRDISDDDNVAFPYKPPPHNPNILLYFKGVSQNLPPLPSEEFTTQQLQSLDKKEWKDTFTLNRLHNQWKTRVSVNFNTEHKKFTDDAVLPQIKENKRYIKESIDLDILELKPKKWNLSTDITTHQPQLKQTLFEASHGLKNVTIVPLKEKHIEEGCDSRNDLIINGNKWNVSTQIENDEMEYNKHMNDINAYKNSERYWKDNEYNRLHQNAFPISNDRKKLEVIRYFKQYRNPLQQSMDYVKAMNKIKKDTSFIKTEIENKVKYNNPGSLKYPEKINALVYKEMRDIYKHKYNESIGKLDKETLKQKQREDNKFKWNDRDLSKKISTINSLNDISWFNPQYIESTNVKSTYQKELLKPLVIKGNEIYNEQEKIQEQLENEYKKEQKRELMLKEKFSSKKRNVKIKLSKYPVNKEIYETMSTTVDSESNDNKIEGENNIKQLEMKLNESHFEDAFRKVSENEVNKKNELVKKYKGSGNVVYKHPGKYREFQFEEKEVKKLNPYSKESVVVNNVVVNMWSCCMNVDKNSKGCQKKFVKKFRWLNANDE